MTCYLCGKPLGAKISQDHIPAQQIWSPEIRRQFNVSRLLTLPTHPECNESFARDEEYAVRILATAAYESPTGRSVVQHGFAKARAGVGLGLHRKIVQSMTERPSGLHLPHGRAIISYEGPRVRRVIWKIVRGLWFLKYQRSLAAETTHIIHVREHGNTSVSGYEEFWNIVRSQASTGDYQRVFAHKYLRFEQDAEVLHGWAMLLWDRLIIYCTHFDPDEPPDLTREHPRGRKVLASTKHQDET